MGRLGQRQLLAHHRRHRGHLEKHEQHRLQTGQAAPFAKPGNWNDPDMLVVGQVGWGKLHPSRLTPDEQYTHISLWCLLSAPLLIGCDMTKFDDFTLNLLSNDEVLALDQDALGKEATCVVTNGDVRVYEKELEDGGRALGFFNLGSNRPIWISTSSPSSVSPARSTSAICGGKGFGRRGRGFTAAFCRSRKIPVSHGVVLYKLTASRGAAASAPSPNAGRFWTPAPKNISRNGTPNINLSPPAGPHASSSKKSE
jgi:hypothetical protein